ncbi:MAG: hypothetical protein R3F49_10825 [Planctomycetota bacterium]
MLTPRLKRGALGALALSTLAFATSAQDVREVQKPRPPIKAVDPGRGQERDPRRPDQGQSIERDMEALAAASEVLDRRGYVGESARLRDVMGELRASAEGAQIELRAKKLLAADVQDKAVRAKLLALAAEGYARAGWESNAATLAWFAEVGRIQASGSKEPLPPMPAGGNAQAGSVMDRMIELVFGASGAHQQLGNPLASRCCIQLGRFYVQRELGQGAVPALAAQVPAPEEPAVVLEDTTRSRLRGLGYVADEAEGRDELAGGDKAREVEVTADKARGAALDLERKALEAQLEALRARIKELEARGGAPRDR